MERSSGGLKTKEICAIIKLGAQLGVKSIKIAEESVSIEYGLPVVAQYSIRGSTTKPALTLEQENELERLRVEQEIEQIKALDPLRYEELLAEGKIEDVHDEQNDRGLE